MAHLQYQRTYQVPATYWEQAQATALQDLRDRVQHDLAVQHPGRQISIHDVQYIANRHPPEPPDPPAGAEYLVALDIRYTIV